MTFFDFLQLVGGIILAVGYIPQISQLIRTKSCGDLNLKTYLYLTLGIGLMELYAINLCKSGNGYMFLLTNSISLVLVSLISVMVIKYRLKEYDRFMRENDPDILYQHAYYIATWEDGSVLITPCEVNTKTKEITKIVDPPREMDLSNAVESVMLYGTEYRVFSNALPAVKKLVDIEDDWLPF